MKWLICILICWCSIGNTTAQHYSFNRYADIDGITRVNISKTLLKAIIKSENPAMKISGNKVNLNNKELLSKMDGILVLTGTNTRIANMMHEDATKLSHTKEYEHILYRNEKELAIDVFTRESKGVILEIILIDKTDQNNRIIQLMGQFTPDDILSMIKI